MRLFLYLLLYLFAYSKSLDVPFVKQQDHFCGPASLSAVLNFYNLNLSQETIAKSVYHPKLKGALITDLEKYARSMGFRAQTRQGSLYELKSLIDRGIPPIILVELGRFSVSNPHYMVVVGYEEEAFIIHTGYEERKRIQATELDRIWSKMGRVMLVVYPP